MDLKNGEEAIEAAADAVRRRFLKAKVLENNEENASHYRIYNANRKKKLRRAIQKL